MAVQGCVCIYLSLQLWGRPAPQQTAPPQHEQSEVGCGRGTANMSPKPQKQRTPTWGKLHVSSDMNKKQKNIWASYVIELMHVQNKFSPKLHPCSGGYTVVLPKYSHHGHTFSFLIIYLKLFFFPEWSNCTALMTLQAQIYTYHYIPFISGTTCIILAGYFTALGGQM